MKNTLTYSFVLFLSFSLLGESILHGSSQGIEQERSIDEMVKDFLEYIQSLPYMDTSIDRTSSSGISISYKRATQ